MVGTLAFDELLSHSELDVVPTDPNSLAALMFTSGTAGAPKAAMLTHGNLLSNISQTLASNPMYAKDVFFGVLPLFHIFGLNVVLGCAMSSGASLVLIERFDPSSALETIRDRDISVMAGAPSMWAALGQTPGVDSESMSTLRLAITGAAKMPEDIAIAFEKRCGVRLIEGYGLTEASPVVSTAQAGVTPLGSIGQVLNNMNVRLVDEQGDDALVGDTGEIWVQGPNVFAGYWNDAEATARVLTADGWLRTGDIAVADELGNLFIVDRAKDLIIVSGFNVYPAEVEGVLSEHPGIAQAAVVGVPHPHTGEAVKAFIVPHPNVYLDEDAIIAYSQQQLSRYKCPSKVLFVESLPVNATGKVLRRALH
jgi:long-chain acyl-CoA synthetase